MTIEQLLECSAADLEKMSDEELRKHFEPYLVVTRPELIEKPMKKEDFISVRGMSAPVKKVSQKQQTLNKANDILKQYGLSLK